MHLFAGCCTPVSEDHEEKFGVPSLKELGLDLSEMSPEVWHGGETEALIRLDRHLERKVTFNFILYNLSNIHSKCWPTLDCVQHLSHKGGLIIKF